MPFHSFVWQRSRVWSRAQAKVGLARHSKFPRPLETLQNRESFRLDLIRSPLSPTSDDRTHYTLSRSPPAALPLIAPATTIILFCSLLVDSRLSTLDPRPVNPSNNHHQPPLAIQLSDDIRHHAYRPVFQLRLCRRRPNPRFQRKRTSRHGTYWRER